MPTIPTYPGVYIEEIPSGVRTITGVSTSVTAFVGSAKRGPINKAVRILSYSDYERRFGGLDADSQMSYAVRQFFFNGGSEAWVVRLAKDAKSAAHTLKDSGSREVLVVTAVDEGRTGNEIEVRIDYQNGVPGNVFASTFNLNLNYTSKDNPPDSITETFANLSMNSQDPRYALDMVNDVSMLVRIERVAASATLDGLGSGTSLSQDLVDSAGDMLDVATLLDPSHNQFRVSVNGLPPVIVQIALPADVGGADPAARLATLCTRIAEKVQAQADGNTALSGFTCAPDGNIIMMTSGGAGEASSVRVLPGERNDASSRLKLGTLNGGIETDAVAAIRPVEIPDHGLFTSGGFGATDLDTLPDATHTSLQISLDGYGPDTISIGDTSAAGADLAAKLGDVAVRIRIAVRALKPSNLAYREFTCTADVNTLVLYSGTRGRGSSVLVSAAETRSIAEELHLLTGATMTQPDNIMLQGGTESPYTEADAYNLFIADRSQRKGIYALESVDLFNLFCLPGVTDPGILMDAGSYCEERRAFLIVDAPQNQKKPEQMVQTISGTALPKTEYGAVYYPWVRIADPLKNGKLHSFAPSGTIAGLYARTDSSRGVWKAPAGTEASLIGVQGVDYALTDGENGTLNPLGVNCVRVFPVYGAVAWGARTLRGADQMTSEYKYIPIRRLALYIEESLYRATKWVVFEPNDEPLWSQIRLNIGAFMHTLFRQGAFQGTTPKAAYFVKCDKETTTQDDINRGIVNIVVGFAPLKPAEFVIIKIQQIAGEIQT